MHHGRTIKVLNVVDAEGETNEAILACAMDYAAETPGSLFGSRVIPFVGETNSVFTVELYID